MARVKTELQSAVDLVKTTDVAGAWYFANHDLEIVKPPYLV